MKQIIPSSALALAAAGLISGCSPREPLPPPASAAGATDTDPQARGLNPPTPEERARMDAMATKNPKTLPNELARERLNAERKAQGLAPLPPEPAPAAGATDTDPQARGLNPPTPEERARMDAMATKNPKTLPNELARERLNAERKAQGLAPLPPEPAPAPPKSAPK